jgi:hypothetical protein
MTNRKLLLVTAATLAFVGSAHAVPPEQEDMYAVTFAKTPIATWEIFPYIDTHEPRIST